LAPSSPLAVFGNGRFEFHLSEVVDPVDVAERFSVWVIGKVGQINDRDTKRMIEVG
jgi:hypothetical protein